MGASASTIEADVSKVDGLVGAVTEAARTFGNEYEYQSGTVYFYGDLSSYYLELKGKISVKQFGNGVTGSNQKVKHKRAFDIFAVEGYLKQEYLQTTWPLIKKDDTKGRIVFQKIDENSDTIDIQFEDIHLYFHNLAGFRGFTAGDALYMYVGCTRGNEFLKPSVGMNAMVTHHLAFKLHITERSPNKRVLGPFSVSRFAGYNVEFGKKSLVAATRSYSVIGSNHCIIKPLDNSEWKLWNTYAEVTRMNVATILDEIEGGKQRYYMFGYFSENSDYLLCCEPTWSLRLVGMELTGSKVWNTTGTHRLCAFSGRAAQGYVTIGGHAYNVLVNAEYKCPVTVRNNTSKISVRLSIADMQIKHLNVDVKKLNNTTGFELGFVIDGNGLIFGGKALSNSNSRGRLPNAKKQKDKIPITAIGMRLCWQTFSTIEQDDGFKKIILKNLDKKRSMIGAYYI
ncbi:filamentous hemagglutinin family N-terminal domain-containing protein [Babesia caballi]|uniref:Filamentous hemagglutinin family N-terminal domain-containing protein n=1 Tax=Babesia caballi TaxID=5871 RepID=A0AAV4M294_BABCB|nr:filamentous hemagglutinin family N-terminal domain-containing protein [Babesia caballi]